MRRRALLQAGIGLAALATLDTTPAADDALVQRAIPSSGERLPVIGLGTSGPFEVGADPAARAALTEVLAAFLAGGGRLIDTSPMYTTAEAVLGELLTPVQRAGAFLATKVWTRGAADGAAQMAESAHLLRRERLDLIQVHNLVDVDTQLDTLRRWKSEGRVRYTGITHYQASAYADLMRVMRRHRPDFVQFNYSVVSREAERELLPLAADLGVAVIVNRAFEDGRLFTIVKGRPLPAFAAEFDCRSWAQLFLKFVLSHPAVTCVIPATGRVAHLRDNLGAGRGPLLDDAARRALADVVARAG